VKKEWSNREITFVLNEYKKGYSRFEIAKKFRMKFDCVRSPDSIKHAIDVYGMDVERELPRVLLIDIETKEWIRRAPLYWSYREAIKNGMKTPSDIDNCAFDLEFRRI
jgi:hypothetical protein